MYLLVFFVAASSFVESSLPEPAQSIAVQPDVSVDLWTSLDHQSEQSGQSETPFRDKQLLQPGYQQEPEPLQPLAGLQPGINASEGGLEINDSNSTRSSQERRLHPHGPIWPRQPTGTPGIDCEPNGFSVRFSEVYYRESDLWGYVHDFDISDKRYRFPEDFGERYFGHPPGFYAATIYTAPSGARVFLVSKQVATEDLAYLECLGVKAAVVFDENGWIEHSFTQTRPSHTFYGQEFPPIPMRITEATEWFIWMNDIEAFIDAQLAAGNTTMIYDDREGCWQAAAVAILYKMLKENLDYHDALDRVAALRPCVTDLEKEEELAWADERLHNWNVCRTQRYCDANPGNIPRPWPFTKEERHFAR